MQCCLISFLLTPISPLKTIFKGLHFLINCLQELSAYVKPANPKPSCLIFSSSSHLPLSTLSLKNDLLVKVTRSLQSFIFRACKKSTNIAILGYALNPWAIFLCWLWENTSLSRGPRQLRIFFQMNDLHMMEPLMSQDSIPIAPVLCGRFCLVRLCLLTEFWSSKHLPKCPLNLCFFSIPKYRTVPYSRHRTIPRPKNHIVLFVTSTAPFLSTTFLY